MFLDEAAWNCHCQVEKQTIWILVWNFSKQRNVQNVHNKLDNKMNYSIVQVIKTNIQASKWIYSTKRWHTLQEQLPFSGLNRDEVIYCASKSRRKWGKPNAPQQNQNMNSNNPLICGTHYGWRPNNSLVTRVNYQKGWLTLKSRAIVFYVIRALQIRKINS